MFKIDFLKGQGLPTMSRPLDVALMTVSTMLAIVVFTLIAIECFAIKSTLRSKQTTLSNLQRLCDIETDAGKHKKRLAVYDQCYAEIADSITRYIQWTPVLHEFAETMPYTMILNELNATRTMSKKKITSKRDPEKKVDIEIFKRKLKANLYVIEDDDGAGLKSFLADLRSSQQLQGLFDDVSLAESSEAVYEDLKGNKHNVKKHIINCQLKSRQVLP
jgi:hypothetical protein